MDEKKFSGESPGTIIKIPEGRAFLPTPLPATYRFDLRLWPLLAHAKQQVALLEGIGRTLPDPAILLNPLEQREALQSSRLEGTYITAKEFLLYDLAENGDDERQNDWREVHNYKKALRHGQASELPLCLRLIRELHDILMTGVNRSDMTPGEFRTHQVAIGHNQRFVPAPTSYLLKCLTDFEQYLNQETAPDSLIHCYLCHYQFETIHPFHDGNGRVGRLLLALMFQRLCGLTKPWLYLSDILERQRDAYCDALFGVSTAGDWTGWLELCLNATIAQANETILRCEKLNSLRVEFSQRVNNCGGSIRLNQIVDELFKSPFVRIANLAKLLGVTYPTAKADCERLVSCNVLTLLPALSPATYYASEVFLIAYEGIGE